MTPPACPRILVLEDEWLIAEQIESALDAAGFEVVGPVGWVSEAMHLLESEVVDAAVLDINVHGERSFAVAERLAARATPFIFLSGYSDADLPRDLGGRPLMQKPIDPGRLGRCVRALVSPPG